MTPEFSRPVAVAHIPPHGQTLDLAANAAECQALAVRFGLAALDSLTAQARLETRKGGQLVRLSGRLRAELVQLCVVSLEPVRAVVEEAFEQFFAPADAEGAENGVELDLFMEQDDPPDPILDGRIDVGEYVAEFLSLAIDPFPRAPGAAFTPPADEPPTADEQPNPFAKLAGMMKKMK